MMAEDQAATAGTGTKPVFYANNNSPCIIRTWGDITADRWTPQYGWRKDYDPETFTEDLVSPQWQKITPEQAQIKINRRGGARDEYMAPAVEESSEAVSPA